MRAISLHLTGGSVNFYMPLVSIIVDDDYQLSWKPEQHLLPNSTGRKPRDRLTNVLTHILIGPCERNNFVFRFSQL